MKVNHSLDQVLDVLAHFSLHPEYSEVGESYYAYCPCCCDREYSSGFALEISVNEYGDTNINCLDGCPDEDVAAYLGFINYME